MTKFKDITDYQIIEAASRTENASEFMRNLHVAPTNGNWFRIVKTINRLKVDTSHWLNKSELSTKYSKKPSLKRLSDNEIFTPSSDVPNSIVKKRLLKLVEYKCLICGISEWLGKHLVLQMDHIDGDHNNNLLSNLRLLCPNCHSQTSTYNQKRKIKTETKCLDCNKLLQSSKVKRCAQCYSLNSELEVKKTLTSLNDNIEDVVICYYTDEQEKILQKFGITTAFLKRFLSDANLIFKGSNNIFKKWQKEGLNNIVERLKERSQL
jgi:Zn finger protein HypA/HybF involved in hydrogenase expression